MTVAVVDVIDSTDWRAMSGTVRLPSRQFVDGDWRDAQSGDVRPVISPRDSRELTAMAWADAADADHAVAAARRAFDEGPWPRLPARERGRLLGRLADLVEEHRAELALLISLEMGKPIRDSYGIELRALIGCLRYYGELADKVAGEIPPTGDGELALVTREQPGWWRPSCRGTSP